MADPSGTALEGRLRAIAADLAFPPTPPLAASVTSRLLSERAATRSRRPFPGVATWTRRRTVVVTVLGLLLVGGVAVAGRLAIGAVGVRIVERIPAPGPTTTEASFGRSVALDDVPALIGFGPAYPPSLGKPDDVRIAQTWSGARIVVLGWRADDPGDAIPGVPWSTVMMELPGDNELAVKNVLGGGAVEPARVDGSRALWIEGPHELILRGPDGEHRLAVEANTLIWQRDGITYRLETLLGKPDARGLAETLP